jgi:hypothetical protein
MNDELIDKLGALPRPAIPHTTAVNTHALAAREFEQAHQEKRRSARLRTAGLNGLLTCASVGYLSWAIAAASNVFAK